MKPQQVIPSWAGRLGLGLPIPPTHGRVAADWRCATRVTMPLIVTHGLAREDIDEMVEHVAMRKHGDVRAAAWYVHDFHMAHGRLPRREEV